MKRAVLCVSNPQDYIDQLDDYSIMIINPNSPAHRIQYLLDHADWSLKITDTAQEFADGQDHANERLFWYTSGTSGDSKFYSFSQSQLDFLTQSIISDLDITANDRYMGVMSLWHAHGQSLYWATRRAGCETKFVSVNHVRQMVDFQPTFVSAIPDILKIIAELPLDQLRFLRSGSAPLSHELYHNLKQKFKIPVIEYFGMTEAMSHVLSNPLNGLQRIGTVGLPTRGVEAKLEDGKLYIKGPTVFRSGWVDTGDLARQDSHGYYQILGRSIDQINVKGYKINPISVEQQIKKLFPEILDVVVFGNSVCNCIYVGDVDIKKIISAMQNIHPACRPSLVKQIDKIPMSDSGKISRTWLTRYFECK
jgi:acyl-coenzyme A synthetase/AMP-(fatty) acid ligase